MCTDKSAKGGAITNRTISNQQLTEALHKSIIRKFKTCKLYSSFLHLECRSSRHAINQ